jgi:chemotaxis protein MotB
MRYRSLFGILILTMFSNGCVSQQSFQSAIQKLERERQQNEQLRMEIERLKADAAKSDQLSGENQNLLKAAQENETRAEDLAAQVKSLSREIKVLSKKRGVVIRGPDMSWANGLSNDFQKTFPGEIRKGSARVKASDDRLTFLLAEPLLFDPDDVEITKKGEETLARLGEVLKKAKGQQIVIGAHLDDVPIAPSMAREFPTAWEFTGTRAIEVVRFLEEESKIRGSVLSAAAYGSTRTVASNATEAGRAQNRRIEVTLLPSFP